MRKNMYFIMATFALTVFFGCKPENDRPAGGTWNSEPLKGYQVTPINGGATITYDIPRDPEILYVMAEYERNGKLFTEKSSIYKNSLTIEGFNTTDKVKVKLYKINKQEQKSQPLEVEFVPMESLVSIAHKSLNLIPGFGGVIASWKNPETTELGVRLMYKNAAKNNELETKEMYFTTLDSDRHSFRGFESKQTTFALTFEDKWGNISDTTWLTTSPFFETMVPKPYGDYRASIPFDNTTSLAGASHAFSTLYDNIVNTSGHGWLSQSGSAGLSITFDMKQVVKLSRIVIHGYHINSVYGQVNITQWEAWGTNKIDFDKLADRPYWLDEYSTRNGNLAGFGIGTATELPSRTFKDDWQYLGWHAIPRYDRLVPPDNAAIAALGANGTEYEMPIDAKPVRYIRLFAREVASIMPPPTTNYFSMGEITFYGDNTVPQE